MHARRIVFAAIPGFIVLSPDRCMSTTRVAAQSRTNLDINIVDVEGGNATPWRQPAADGTAVPTDVRPDPDQLPVSEPLVDGITGILIAAAGVDGSRCAGRSRPFLARAPL